MPITLSTPGVDPEKRQPAVGVYSTGAVIDPFESCPAVPVDQSR